MFSSAFLLEDNAAVVTALRMGLRGAGIELTVAKDLAEARDVLDDSEPELYLIDLVLPDGSGLDIVREVRAERPDAPVVILTGLVDEEDVVAGIEAGADLYLKKPFTPKELVAHLEALHRRVDRTVSVVAHAGVEADLVKRRAMRNGKSARLTDVETRLLATLLSAEGEVVERDELLLKVWNLTFDPGTGLLHSHIRNLRRKLKTLGVHDWIEAVRGRGYRFVAAE